MTFAFFLLGAALLLIFLEFFLPGGIIGAIGIVFLLLSIVFFIQATNSILAVILYLIFVIFLLVVLISLTLRGIKKTRKKSSIYLATDQEGFFASKYDETMIGKKGVAVSDLKPAGHILVENKRLQALSKSGYIQKGASLEVVGGRGAYLIVRVKEV